ncbi:MAG: oxygen-independent coproporphyrinogen III oxidase [Gammaproteobacteria bacterium]|nr:oxygen-independent coproporphyrinogen III oxidase [Gammaproteobacteria bacterium]
MLRPPVFKEELINRYDSPGPRYTSYPPTTEFHDRIGEREFREWARQSNEELIPKPLSLYFHIPFCSSLCYYCACSKIVTRRKEKAEPYLRDMYREIEIQSRLFDGDREVRQLHWGGGTPGFLSHAQALQLMQKIRHHFRLRADDGGEYSIELDPRVVEKGGISQLRNLGFNRVSLGVQDFDPTVQQAINRIQSLEQTAEVMDEARGHGFRSINIDLIYGLPQQTAESFGHTLDLVISLDPDRIALYSYTHLPHRYPSQCRIVAEDLPDSGEKLNILRLALDRLGVAGYEYIGMDHFAKPGDELAVAQRNGNLHRSFQGYAAHARCDSIGFGVSAISHVGDNFSQNTTSLDAYHDDLARDQLPVARGFQSEDDDLLRREIIQDLVCHFELDLHGIEKRWDIDFDQHFADELERLGGMQNDGLVEVSHDQIRVLENGRLLVRNICMIFDRYQQTDRIAGLFSGSM